MPRIKIGKCYHHFKGNDYEVINIATDSETLESVVVYKSLKDDKVWVRPYDMFDSLVDIEKYPNVNQKYRFELIDNKIMERMIINGKSNKR